MHLPRYHSAIPIKDFCPKAWSAICELCGGEDRIDTGSSKTPGLDDATNEIDQSVINDGFIVNVGSAPDAQKWKSAAADGTPSGPDNLTPAQQKLLDPHDRDNWHVDGDFFHHFLDSREQGLLPIVLFGDINIGGGGTMICPDAIPTMAKHLYAHPEGVMPDMTAVEGREKPYKEFDHGFYDDAVKEVEKERFRTATGKAGDIYLLHPLMVHSAAPNYLRGKLPFSPFHPHSLPTLFSSHLPPSPPSFLLHPSLLPFHPSTLLPYSLLTYHQNHE